MIAPYTKTEGDCPMDLSNIVPLWIDIQRIGCTVLIQVLGCLQLSKPSMLTAELTRGYNPYQTKPNQAKFLTSNILLIFSHDFGFSC